VKFAFILLPYTDQYWPCHITGKHNFHGQVLSHSYQKKGFVRAGKCSHFFLLSRTSPSRYIDFIVPAIQML